MTPTLLGDAAPAAPVLAGHQVRKNDPGPVAKKKRGFFFDTLTVSVFAILAKIAGAGKAVVIASVFGSGPALDAYLLAFLLPSLLADTFCGALVPVTVPRLVELEHRARRSTLMEFYATVLHRGVAFSLLGSAAIAIAIGAAMVLGGAAVPQQWRTVGILTLLMLPVIPCNAVANVWRAVLNSQHRFAIPSVTVVLTPAVLMICVLLAGHWRGGLWGGWVLAAGTTLGAAAELAMLGAAVRRTGFPLVPQRRGTDPSEALHMHGFRKDYGYLVAAAAVSGGTVFLGQSMAAWLGAGSVSILNYGTRLAGVLLAIGPAALSVAVLPRFSQMVAERDWDTLRRTLRRLLLGSFTASGAVAAASILFSAPIVRLTLQRGAFTAADTGAVAAVQAWSLLQMPFVVGITLLMRVLAALKANRALLPLSAATLVVNVTLNYVLMNRYGVSGIALASSIAQGLLFAAMATLVFGPVGNRLMRERS